MTQGLEIRRLTAEDGQIYREIRLAALRADPEAFGSTYEVEVGRPLSHFVERVETTTIFAAFDAGRVVGMIGLKAESGAKDRHKAFVWGFYVEAGWRGRGVGAALMGELVAAAATGDCEQLKLTVVSQNQTAIALYERFGFRTYGVEPRALKSPAGYSDETLMVRFMAA